VDRMMITKRHFEDAEVTGYEGLAPAMTNDPKDLHVLAAAIERYNLRHFPPRSREQYE
jgi:hypothetical protein